MDKTESGWSAPRHLPTRLTAIRRSLYPITLKNGNYTLARNARTPTAGRHHRAVPQKDGNYTVENPGPLLNSSGRGRSFRYGRRADAAARSHKATGLSGGYDLYVSHKLADGKWSEPANLGRKSIRRDASYRPNYAAWQYLIWTSCRLPPLAVKPPNERPSGVARAARTWQWNP